MKSSSIFILGCNHEAQVFDLENSSTQHFRKHVASIVTEHRIRFIGEEANQRHVSIAKDFAAQNEIAYCNVDIPLEVQKQILHRPVQQFNGEEFENLIERCPYAKAWNLVREYHMGQIFLEKCSEFPSLLICGASHVQPLKEMFEKQGFSVISVEDSLLSQSDNPSDQFPT